MKLVVGLGNPGAEYNNTRHNVGYMFLDYITDGREFLLNKKFNALEYEMTINGEKILFIKPLSFMNLSGEVVIKYVNYYKLKLDDILIIQDDLDMDLCRYKFMYNHGDGGHNGIKNIILKLGSKEFLRLKIGISKCDNDDVKDYVLGKFTNNEIKTIDGVFCKFEKFLVDFVSMDRDMLMGKYNSIKD